jgi:hypothetical protein
MACLILVPLGISAAAFAQTLTFPDLADIVVDAVINRSQEVIRGGQKKSVRVQQQWRFTIAADNTIETSVTTIALTPKGKKKSKPMRGTFILDDAQDVPSMGGGKAGWSFADGTLTFTRTFPAGAYRAAYAFARSDAGLTCTVTEAFAREGGKGPLKLQSAFGGVEVTVLSSKQLASTCKVSTQK